MNLNMNKTQPIVNHSCMIYYFHVVIVRKEKSMKINSVSSASFGKTAYTKNNNEYKKTNTFKIIGTSVGIATAAFTLSLPKILTKMFNYPMERAFSKKFLYLDAAASLIIGIGGGALIDYARNKSRARKADQQTQNI